MPYRRYLGIPTLVPLLMLVAPSMAAPEPQVTPSLVILLDGSGSMWGNLAKGPTTKLDLSKKELVAAVKTVPPTVNLGLASFGHRKAGNCSDADLIVETGLGVADDVILQIEKLNPRGKGPLSLALSKTAQSLPPDSRGVIFLVHDGLDNCRGDPCAVADEIAASHPNLAIHVASLDLNEAETSTLKCLAEKTSGKVTSVSTAATFQTVIKEAFDVAMRRSDEMAGADGAAAEADSSAAAADTTRPGLSLKALLKQGDQSQPVTVSWRVAKSDAPKTIVVTRRGSSLAEDLEPGDYVVSLTAGLAQQTLNVTVADTGVSKAEVTLDAALLRFSTPATANLQSASNAPPVFYTIRAGSTADESNIQDSKPLWIGYGRRDQSLIIPPGRYRIDLDRGQTKKTTDIVIKAGETVPVQFMGDVGQLTLTSHMRQGPEDPASQPQGPRINDGVLYILSTDDPTARGRRREVARSASPDAWFQLSAGIYYVEAHLGQARQESRIAIGAGSNIRHAFSFDVVDVSLKAMVGNTALGKDLPVSYRIVALDGGEREIARSSDSQAKFLLPAGRYRIETDVGLQLQKQQTLVTLAASDAGIIPVPLKAGRVTLEPDTTAQGKLRRIQVRNSSQNIVWRGRLSKPKLLVLPPGTYEITGSGGPDAPKIGALTLDEGQSLVVQVRPKS